MTEEPRKPRTFEHTVSATSEATASLDAKVIRGLNDTRLAILGIMAQIALTVALSVSDVNWWCRVGIGMATFVGLAVGTHLLLRSERATSGVMGFAHWVLGRKH